MIMPPWLLAKAAISLAISFYEVKLSLNCTLLVSPCLMTDAISSSIDFSNVGFM